MQIPCNFLVTWSHCAQSVSGLIWTNFLGGMQLDIAFNMPLFMIMSGWFISLKRLRDCDIKQFVIQKFQRLIIPSVVWYCINQLLSLQWPDSTIFQFYWYLNSLFISLCIIMFFSKLIENDLLCSISSIAFVLIIPYTNFNHVNFMLPFLIGGMYLRELFELKTAKTWGFVFFLIGIALCPFWRPQFSVYLSPWNSMRLNDFMIFAYLFRFAIGFSLSAAIIIFVQSIELKIQPIAPLGQYSLVIYTASIAILGLVNTILNYFCLHTNQYFVIDVLSLSLCSIITFGIFKFAKSCQRNKMLSLLFLGES